jgi:glucose/arabinose dehydrogenase
MMAVTHAPGRYPLFVLTLLVLALAAGTARAQYVLERAYPAISFPAPTDVRPANDGTNRMFVVQKGGTIRVFQNDYHVSTSKVFLDISYKIRTAGEAGLLGLVFDPKYASNGIFYIYYETKYPTHNVVARMKVSADPDVADYNTEEILIDAPQFDPGNAYHCGGQLAFGNDGLLYIAMGDNRNSPSAQDLTDLQGSILRIDVHVDPKPIGFGAPLYQIPSGNPFVTNTNGYRPEIYAYGFRNPWRFAIDPYTNELWVCDVGENDWEELDVVRAGKNYGWPLMEGPDCFPPGECDTTSKDLKLPLYSYSHDDGSAIVGGCRYWGSRLPELAGVFVFADYTSGVVWGLHYDGAGTPERFDLAHNAPSMFTVGSGFDDEILMGSVDGQLYRLARTATPVTDAPLRSHLAGNFPNPFNPSTTIRFVLDHAAVVRLDIVSIRGERVRQFEFSPAGAGSHDVVWRGETDRGSHVASGVYFCRLIVDGTAVDSSRLVLVQ